MRTEWAAAVDDVRARLRGMVLKGVVRLVEEAAGVRLLQVTGRKGETFPDAQHWEPLGMTARPRDRAEALILQLSPNLTIVVQVVDRRHRPTDQDEGEAGLYDCPGSGQTQQRLRLRPGTGIEVEAPYGVAVTGDQDVTGALTGGTVRSDDGVTGSFTEPDTGQKLTFTGGVLTGATPPLGP